MFCCQFLALLLAALIEREVRDGMTHATLDTIDLYPELRSCRAPSTERIQEIFTSVSRHQLHHDGTLIQTFQPELSSSRSRPTRPATQRLHAAHQIDEITRPRSAERQE